MNLNGLAVLDLASQNMKYLTERERVIAGNIANANTPGYLAKDVKKPEFGHEVSQKLGLVTTNKMHMSGRGQASFTNEVYTPQPTTPLTIDGNGVVMEEQLNEASKASSEYNRMIAIYNKYRSMIKTSNTKVSI